MLRSLSFGLASLVLFLPGLAFADLTGTQTLNSGQALSLDTGSVVSSGSGDIQWDPTNGISFNGTAKGFDYATTSGSSGTSEFNILNLTTVEANASIMSQSAIPPSTAVQGNVFMIETNGGNYAKLLVTAQSGGSITLQFDTFGIAAGGAPFITSVLNNYGLIPAGFTNSGIAPSTLFIIKGTGLADPSAQAVLQSATASGGLPKSLNGATVSVTVGSTTVQPAFYYAIATQLALVLPSGTPTGSATVTVTYNGQTSAPFSFQVVKSALGIAAYYGAGTGMAHAQDVNYNYYNYTNSIPQGSVIRLIGSGLGADDNPERDTEYVTPSSSDAINALSNVYVGGISASIVYQGPEGYPGLDEIDITVPENAPTGCFISIVGVTAAGVPTNSLTLPIGTGACSDTELGYSSSLITTLSGDTNVRLGYVGMFYSVSGTQAPQTQAVASFQEYSVTSFTSAGSGVTIGGCITSESATGSSITTTPLNAGTITVTSPNSVSPQSVQLASLGSGLYASFNSSGGSSLPTGFLTNTGGTFQFSATAGTTSPAVGAFNTQVVFPSPLLSWTNESSIITVTKSAGLTITWSGGQSGTFVIISGSSAGAGGTISGSFTCLAPVAAGTFTVPPYVLAILPTNDNGQLSVGNETTPVSFTATGLDYGYGYGFVEYSGTVAYQ